MNNYYQEHMLHIDSLTVFSALKRDPVIHGLRELLSALAKAGPEAGEDSGAAESAEAAEVAEAAEAAGAAETAADTPALVGLYCDVVEALYPHGSDLGEYIRARVLEDDNFYVQAVAAGKPLSDAIQETARQELNMLQDLASLPVQELRDAIGYEGFLPSWTCGKLYLLSDFTQKLERIPTTGLGVFARYMFFRVGDADGRIIPIRHPDIQPLDSLFRYERERNLIIRNTQALLEDTGGCNMLLYGDAGTGKSSTIKAVAAEYADRGLRLIEIKKSQLLQIPEVLDQLADSPLKFILFIDDLSFNGNDDNFSALKATLEGSAAGRGANVVIYATSNRRHLVKESFADRAGDELHVNDTLQETMSLSARFGLIITFSKPDKDDYLDIVFSLADEYGLDIPREELARRAEAHAIRSGGRSPRTAKQLIELLRIGL